MTTSRDLLNKTCWVITEGMIGTENQCLSVAEALGLNHQIKKISLKQPWKTLSPWLGLEIGHSFRPPLTPPWPDILIASGRKSIGASRYIKKKSAGKTFTVQIQDPKISPCQFDLVAVPFHDTLRGENVIVTHGAPNRLTQDKLNDAKKEFSPLFKKLKPDRVAVLIGGNSRTHKITQEIMKNFIEQLSQISGSLMITTSRRTGEENLKIIQNDLSSENNYIWNGTGKNPYWGMLAWADYIIVTKDSVSMLSDAGTTGKPVYTIDLEGSSPRFDRLHTHFKEIGVSRPFSGNLTQWEYEPLNDAQLIAKAIKKTWGKL